MLKLLLFFFCLYALQSEVSGQDFSNKGKDFWVGYGNHVRMFNPGAAETMQIYLTSDVNTTGVITVTSIGFSQTFTVTANQITVVNIPRSAALLDEGLYNHGIHITAVKPIVAYGFIYVNAISGATVYLPTNTLGKEYFSLNYTQVSNEPNSYSYFFVEAVETGSTVIEIKPSQNTKGGWAANSLQTITLTQGQIYQVLSATDLTGSTIKSIASSTGGCKKIAVFCGSGKISIGCPGSGSSDNLYQQMYPASTWGKKYILIPSGNRANVTLPPVVNTNFFRIYRPDPTSVLTLNGVLIPSASFVNNIYQFSSNLTNLVESDKSILVAQYFTTANCSGNTNPHDPEMIYLNPVEQTVSDVTVNSMQPTANTNINQHFINVVLRNSGSGVSSFKIDGVAPNASSITTLTQDNNYAYTRIYTNGNTTFPLSSGAHRLTCDSGFNAIAYGFGQTESYGYSAGTNLKDLFQQISVQSQFGIESSPSVCTNSPFKFRVSLPYCADSIEWDLSNLPGPPLPSTKKIYYLSCFPGNGGPDSTTMVNGKQLYWYSLPNLYTFSTAGSYPVTITSYNTGSTQCGSSQDIDFDLSVFDPPNAGFKNNLPGCPNEPVQFTDTTVTVKPNYKWAWNFGDSGSGASNTSSQQNPLHIFSSAGPHTVTLITTTSVGCFSNAAIKVINVPALINATIAGTNTVCQNAPPPNITFTIFGGLPPYKINYTLSTNGGGAVAQTAIITNTTINNLPVPTGTVGTYAYSITGVENSIATFCNQSVNGQSATVTIKPLPVASISGNNTVCQNSTITSVTFTGSGGTAPYIFNYTLNGFAQSITSVGDVTVINVATNVAGIFSYVINSVSDASASNCLFTYTNNNPSAVVTVQQTPTATITGSASVCIDATAPVITFTGINGTAPYEFTYNIDGGPSQTISTTGSSNTAALSVPMTVTGTFVYTLLSVKNTSPIMCAFPVTGAIATVVINTLPTATINGTTTICQNSTSPNIIFTGANAVPPYTFTYTINGGSPQTVSTTSGNSITVAAPTTFSGTFVFALTQVKDASSTQCIKTYTNNTATVTVNQLAIATITGNSSVCQSSPKPQVTFSATGGVGPYTFTYTLNGISLTATTSLGNSVSVPVSTTTPGTFTFTLQSVQESSSVTCTQIQSGTVVVTVKPKPTANYSTVGLYCQLNSIDIKPNFGITPSGSVVSWMWNYGDGSGPQTRPNGNPFTLTYLTAGTKIVTFKTVSDLGCESDLFSTPIVINSKPKAGFRNPAACLADAQAQFTDTSKQAGVGASIVYWEWDFGDGTPVFAGSGTTYQNPLHSYLVVGQKTVKLIVTSNSGCKDTVVQKFFINGEVTRAAFTPVNANNLCSNRPVQIRENSIVNVGGLIRTDIYWDYANATTVFDRDDIPTPGKIYIHNYPNLQTDKTYSIRYFAYSGFNGVCQKDTIINIIVRASPVAQFFSVPDVCLNGGPVVLNQGSASGGTGVYMGPGVTFNGGVYTFNPLATGVTLGTNNAVIYTVSSPVGCDSARIQQIKVLAPPVANAFGPVGNVCQNTNITFNQTSTMADGAIVKWIYNWNDGTPNLIMNSGVPVNHLYTTSGSHTATLTLETAYGCRNIPLQTTFTVNPQPSPDFTFTASACLPKAKIDFVNITPPILSDWSYKWYFVQNPLVIQDSSILQSPSHTYTSVGPHAVTLISTSPITGCTNTVIKQVNTIHKAPLASFNFDKPSICVAQSVNVLQNSTPEEGSLVNYSWNYGDNSTALGQLPSAHTYASMGTFNVKLIVTNSFGCVDDSVKTFVVYPNPVVYAGPDDVVLEGGTFNLKATATGNNLTFLWSSNPSPSNLSSTTILNPVANPVVDITYILRVYAQGGCTNSDSVFIKVLKFPEIPNTFTPNNDGIHDFWEIKYLFTYPGNKVQVFTRTGQLVFESKGYAKPWDGNMNGKSLPFDTYYYIIEPGSGRKPITGFVTIIK